MNRNFTIKLYLNFAYTVFERKNVYLLPILICMGMFVSIHTYSQSKPLEGFDVSNKLLNSDGYLKGLLDNRGLQEPIQSSLPSESILYSLPLEKTFDLINRDVFFLATLILFNSTSYQSELFKTYCNGECQLAFPEIKVFQVYHNAKKSEDYFNSIKIRKKEEIKLKYSSIEYG
ncbi:hypothetical protein [Lacihabitans lacunae]|uniref:Uncharacterized protein n=1 Tax=Lacihabitans lacunae TaxID=1028214 RepID=A0ABV7Z0G1_9BACT